MLKLLSSQFDGYVESAVSVDKLLKLDAGFDPVNILVLWKGYFRWQELGYSFDK